MDFGISHLSYDAGPSAKLDAKEVMETRDRNAREDRALIYRARLMKRAQEVTQRNTEYEKRALRSTLQDLHAKTPYLESFSPRGFLSSKVKPETQVGLLQTEARFATIDRGPPPRYLPELGGHNSSNVPTTEVQTKWPGSQQTTKPPSMRKYLPPLDRALDAQTGEGNTAQNEVATDWEDVEKTDNLKHSTKNYIRKSRYIGNSLKRIYKKRQRQSESHGMMTSRVVLPAVGMMQRTHLVLETHERICEVTEGSWSLTEHSHLAVPSNSGTNGEVAS